MIPTSCLIDYILEIGRGRNWTKKGFPKKKKNPAIMNIGDEIMVIPNLLNLWIAVVVSGHYWTRDLSATNLRNSFRLPKVQ